MKNVIFYIFIFLVGCNSTNKDYICGDRPCIDKKEFKKYAAETLTIEIQPSKDKRNNSIDLVKLNTESDTQLKDNKSENEKAKIKAEKIRLINEKKRLKYEKIELKKKRKFRENEEKKLSKLTNKKTNMNKKNQKKQIVNSNKDVTSIKNTNKNNENDTHSICKIISDCNIDEIAEILIQKGKEKNFPDITAN